MSSPYARIASATAVLLALAAVAFVLLLPGGGDTLTAEFSNAGRLVKGGDVRIGGYRVGDITRVDLGPSGLAEVTMSLKGAGELHEGTRARIRAVGAATLTNNFVELVPGPASAPVLSDGAVLPPTSTEGIVDVDALLSMIDPKARADVRGVLANGADVFSGSGAAWFNGMLAKLNPALGDLRGVTAQLSSDQAQLGRLITTAEQAADAIRSRRGDLSAAVDHTATTMDALARERAALGSALQRAPGFLRQAQRTLDTTASTVKAVRATFRLIPPAAHELGPFLDRVNGVLPAVRPVARDLNTQLPRVRDALQESPALARSAVPALTATGQMLGDARPILRGLRYYAPDFLIGIFNGLLTIGAGNFNKYGHYLHISFLQNSQDLISGGLSGLFTQNPLAPGVLALRSGVTQLCPGSAAPPAPDGSSPYVPDPTLCDPKQNASADVNTP